MYGHPLAGLLWERTIRESSFKIRLGKSSKLGCFFVNREKGLFLSGYVDDLKLAGKKQTINQTGNTHERSYFGEPTSFLDHECQISKDIL